MRKWVNGEMVDAALLAYWGAIESLIAERNYYKAEIERLRKLADAYKDYAILLEGAESRLLGLAHVHGYRTPPEGIERGKKLRAGIDRLNQQLREDSSNGQA